MEENTKHPNPFTFGLTKMMWVCVILSTIEITRLIYRFATGVHSARDSKSVIFVSMILIAFVIILYRQNRQKNKPLKSNKIMNTNEKLDLLDQKLERFSGNIKAILDKTTEDGQFAPTNKELLYISSYQVALNELTKYYKLNIYSSITTFGLMGIAVLIWIIFPTNPFISQWGGFVSLFIILCSYFLFRKLKRKSYNIAEVAVRYLENLGEK